MFTNQRTERDDEGYHAMAQRIESVAQQPGYPVRSTRDADGSASRCRTGTVYAHCAVENQSRRASNRAGKGKSDWYEAYFTRIAKVERRLRDVAKP